MRNLDLSFIRFRSLYTSRTVCEHFVWVLCADLTVNCVTICSQSSVAGNETENSSDLMIYYPLVCCNRMPLKEMGREIPVHPNTGIKSLNYGIQMSSLRVPNSKLNLHLVKPCQDYQGLCTLKECMNMSKLRLTSISV